MKLQSHAVEKPWGRTNLPAAFGLRPNLPIGEIWFDGPASNDLPLLVKYIFTSEKLSIQVHPNNEEARQRGLIRGKNECWYILDAEQGATLGLGLKAPATAEALRAAAIDGSIEQLMDWRPVAPGDFFFVPAGTIHAIGAGITLLEVQQNADVTYRLYDYGRPRELHLEDGMTVAKRGPYAASNARASGGPINTVLIDGPYFSLLRTTSPDLADSVLDQLRWIMPIKGTVTSNGETAGPSECLLLEPGRQFSIAPSSSVLIAATEH